MTPKELQDLIDLCRANNVQEVKCGDVHLVLGPVKPIDVKKRKQRPLQSDYQRFLYAATAGYELLDDEELTETPPPPPNGKRS